MLAKLLHLSPVAVFIEYFLCFITWYPAITAGSCLLLTSFFLFQPSVPTLYRSASSAFFLAVTFTFCGFFVRLIMQVLEKKYNITLRNARIGFGMGAIGIAILLMCTPEKKNEMHVEYGAYLHVNAVVRVVQRKLITRFHNSKWSITLEIQEINKKGNSANQISSLKHSWIQCMSDQPCPVKIGRKYTVDGILQVLSKGEGAVAQVEPLRVIFRPDWKTLQEIETSSLIWPFWEVIGEKRILFHRWIESRVHEVFTSSERTCQVILSLCLGIALPLEVQQEIHRVGLDHLFAISGFHFGCVIFALAFIFRKINEYAAVVITLLFSTLFFFLIGPELPSVLRSWISVVVTSLAIFQARSSAPLNTLGVALYFSLIARPQFLYHIGFQLSFIATAAILLLSGPLQFIFDRYVVKKRNVVEISKLCFLDQILYVVARFFICSLSISLSVWAFIIPYASCFLDGFQPLGFIYNILLTPLFSFALIGSILSFLIWLIFPSISIPCAFCVEKVIDLSFNLIESTAYTPIPSFGIFTVVFFHLWITYVLSGALLIASIIVHVAWRRGEGPFSPSPLMEKDLGVLGNESWKACI